MKVRILAVLMIALFTLLGMNAQAQSVTANTRTTTVQENRATAHFGHGRHCSGHCRNHCHGCRHERRHHRAHMRHHCHHGHKHHRGCYGCGHSHGHRKDHRKGNKIYHG